MTLDDATGAIYSAFLIEEEGTASTFRALKEVFGEHGLPMSLYTDRGALPVPVAYSTGIVILLTSAVMPFTYTTWNRYRIHFGRLPTDAP